VALSGIPSSTSNIGLRDYRRTIIGYQDCSSTVCCSKGLRFVGFGCLDFIVLDCFARSLVS